MFLSLVGTLAFTSSVGRSKQLPFCNSIDNNIRRVHLEASTSSTNIESQSEIESSSTPTPTSFTSPTYKVYLEDTDSYGVMYNSNYLRSYERALSNLFRSSDGSYDRHRWIITHVTKQKFRSSPALGEEFIIRGDLVYGGDDNDDNAKDNTQTWQLEMVTKNIKSEKGDDWIVHNSAQVTLSRPATSIDKISYSSTSTASSKKRFEEIHRAYYDELDSHYYPDLDEYQYHVPLRSAMNYFERTRSNVLGGPDVLAKMQNEEDILWVVTGADECELLFDSTVLDNDLNVNEEDILSLDWHLTPGKDVIVDTDIFIKRRGMFVECHHRLLLDVKLNNGENRRRLLAKAKMTMMAINGSTRRPTSKLPKWVLNLLGE